MNINIFLTSVAIVAAAFVLSQTAVQAQTPPTPETTFTNVSANLWGTAGNWSAGIPTTTAGNLALDDALIGANQTAVYNQTTNGSDAFGTLTLGAGATLQNQITSSSTFMGGKNVFLNNNSVFEITSGSMNSTPNFQIVPGATATLKGAMAMVQGSITGAGNLNVTLSTTVPEWRALSTSFSGNLTFSSDGTSSRRVGLSKFTGVNTFGTGTATFNDNTYLVTNLNGTATNKLSSSSTLKMVGDSGSTTLVKLQLSSNNQTVSNFVVDSPGVALTGTRALMTTGTATLAGTLTVGTTTTFQGTANTVEIDNLMTTPTGNSLVTKNLTFGGSGTWAVTGDGVINLSGGVGGSTITTNVNASISNALSGPSGFTKAGNGTLTLTGNSALTGTILVSTGSLVINRAVASNNVTVDSSLGGSGTMVNAIIGGFGSVNPGNSPGILTAAATDPTGGLDYNFELGATGSVPLYSNAAASVNDVLRLTSATPFTAGLTASNIISLYLGVTSLTGGDVFTGGFFTDNDVDFLASIDNATFQYFLSDVGGATPYNGANYTQYTGPLLFDVSTVAVPTANFAGGTVDGYVSMFTVVPEPHTALLGAIGLIALLRRRR